MKRQTVDYGIDLGTTNSAIARVTDTGAEIVKNQLHGDTTPSAVARTSTGRTVVGQYALEPATKFKLLMGTTNRTRMRDGSEMLPEELSAEVLKELKSAVQLRYAEQLEHVVITVPAMFQQPQCEATHRAAELAGLSAVTLIQEPIAAATAYLNDCADEGYYLVYDLGGGTFDVSILRVKDDEMIVVAHGGDNHLGGSDFDRALYDWVFRRLTREIGSLELDVIGQYRLLQKCERARKQLSVKESTFIDLSDRGLPVDELTVEAAVIEDLIEPHVSKTILLAQARLEEAGLQTQDINRILLVGGPTHTPYIRERLEDELQIPLYLDDPMTIVARGAAIHAGSLLRSHYEPADIRKPTGAGVTLELHYEPVSPDVHCTVSGKVIEPEGFAGEVRLVRAGGDWDTGWIALRGGAFLCETSLRNNTSTDFQLSVRDLKGNLLSVMPEVFSIRHGIAAAKPVTPYSYGVALKSGEFGVVLERGKTLPAYGKVEYYAAKTVPANSAEELPVYFLEGSSPIADDNVMAGVLRIRGTDIKRTLNEGETIEIRINVNESRRLKARVSIPLHDIDIEVPLNSLILTPSIEDLRDSLTEFQTMLSDVSNAADESASEQIRQLSREFEEIEADLERAEAGETEMAVRVAKKVADAKGETRKIHRNLEPAIKYEEAIGVIDWAESVVREFNEPIADATLGDLREQAERYLRLEDEKGLESVAKRASDLGWRYYVNTSRCWEGLVAYLREQRRFAQELVAYDEYLKRAEDCLLRQDFEGVRVNGVQAMSYLPDRRATNEGRFYDSGLKGGAP